MQNTKEWQQSLSRAEQSWDQGSIEVTIMLKKEQYGPMPITEVQLSMLCGTIADVLGRALVVNNSLSTRELSDRIMCQLTETK